MQQQKLLKTIFQPAALIDEHDRRMVLIVLNVAIAAALLLAIANINRMLMLVLGAVLILALLLALRGTIRPAGILAPLAGLVIMSLLIFQNQGLRDLALLGLPVVIIAASLMNGRWGSLVFGVLSLLVIITFGLVEAAGIVTNQHSPNNSLADYLVVCISIILITILQWAVIQRLDDTILRAQRELTERQHAEKALRASEEVYRFLVQEAPVGILVFNPEGTIQQANPTAAALLGYQTEEMLGMEPPALLEPQNLSESPIEIDQLLAGQTIHMERILLQKDGASLPVIGSYKQMPDGSFQYIFQDLRQQKQAEAAIRSINDALEQRVRERTAELEASNQELEAFAYSISHDLSAPLRAIHGYTHFLDEAIGDKLDAEQRDWLNRVRSSALRLDDLIKAILQFSRLGRQPLNKSILSTQELVALVISEIPVRDRVIEWKVARLPDCLGDRGLLHQVFYNLLDNAIKYTQGCEAARIEVGCLDQAGKNVFFVRDNGAGFDMRFVHKLFGVFQRLHSDIEFEGTGIGLANVHRIVTRHGGRIWAESQPQQGAVFYFTLG